MYKIAYYVMAGVAFLISSFLFMQSLFTTVRISFDGNEKSYYIDGNPAVIGILVFITMAILLFVYSNKGLRTKIAKYFMIIMLTISPVFALMAQNIPFADQYSCMETAAQMLEGNMSAFDAGNYMDKYANQNGLVLFYYVLGKVFGSYNYILVQLLNAVMIDVLYVMVYRYLKKYAPKYTDITILCLCAFFPLTLYTTFVYGTMIGLVLSIVAMIFQQMFFREHKWKYLLYSGVLIALAVQFKSNYLVFFVGMLICLVFHFVKEKSSKKLIPLGGVFLLCLCLVFGNSLTRVSLNKITDGASAGIKGTPSLAWVVMGLQESNRAPGWYNAYNGHVFEENNFDYELTQLQCKQDLQEEIVKKLNNPKESLVFFSKKIASQWCEPSFQGFWNNREEYKSEIKRSDFYYDITSSSGRLNRIIYFGLDIFQSFVYLGVIFYIILDKRKIISHNIGLIIFIGGFVFHLFWEGKSSYAFPYFVIIIPYAVSGMIGLFDRVIELRTGKITEILADRVVRKKAIVNATALVATFVCLLCVKDFRITNDTDDWNEYVRLHRFVPEGKYSLESVPENQVNFPFNLIFYPNKHWVYELRSENDTLKIEGIDLEEEDEFIAFKIERLNGGYCFRWYEYMDQVLTYDPEMKSLALCTYEENNKNQIWYLNK